MSSHLTVRVLPWGLLLLFLSLPTAFSCPIPVFRYAVEYWEPDPYRITVFYRGELTGEEAEAVDLMRRASFGQGGLAQANLELRLVDLEEQPYAMDRYLDDDQLAAGGNGVELPRMVVQYPVIEQRDLPLWQGRLSTENAEQLLFSPSREEAAADLARGIPVWVFVESGNRRQDNQAFELLTEEIRRLEQTLELPDPEQWWDQREGAALPEIKFSIMRISRNDPGEQHFINMLMNSENDLYDLISEPMVFPLYGRGISLWALVGKGINAWTLTEAAEHLVGPCSCQVKMLNPGVDILMAKNWAESVEIISDTLLAPVSGIADFEERGAEVARRLEEESDRFATSPGEREDDQQAVPRSAPEDVEADRPDGEDRLSSWLLPLVFGGGMVLVILIGLIVFNVTGEKGVKRQ